MKQLHRRILLSQTYRLSSDLRGSDDDPANVHLTRFARRRLEAEPIRDAMLAISGQLDTVPANGHPLPAWDQKRYGLNGPFHEEYASNKRSVYLLTQRLFDHSFLGLFDPPDRSATTAIRSSSDVPAQSLFLMNSPFIQQRARAFAERLVREWPDNDQRIVAAYRLAYGRSPGEAEHKALIDFLDGFDTDLSSEQTGAADRQRAWTSIARALLTSNEFFFID